MKFTKMQGLGNDYLYVFGEVPSDIAKICSKLSDRHFGAGSDGMIYISDSNISDFKMRIFNSDGSEGKMCGNGIRCVGKYLYDKGYTDKTELKIETLSGIKTLKLEISGGKVKAVSVGMGSGKIFDDITLNVLGKDYRLSPVSVGNPHAVIFCKDVNNAPVETVGKIIEKDTHFKDGVNVEFAEIIDEKTIRMRVWERGSGITLACGTGACATVFSAVSKNYVLRNEFITVKLDGGELYILVDEKDDITMRGSAEFVYEGEVYDKA